MPTISVDGPGLCIDIICGVGETDVTVSVQDIYEAWKDWMLLSDNAKFTQAMSSAGGDPLGGGERLGAAFFIYASDGWRICPATTESAVRIVLAGNLFPDVPGTPIFSYDDVVAGGHTHIEMRTSSLPSSIETGVSGLTASESSQLAKLDSIIVEAGRVLADIRAVRGIEVNGTGTAGDPWGP